MTIHVVLYGEPSGRRACRKKVWGTEDCLDAARLGFPTNEGGGASVQNALNKGRRIWLTILCVPRSCMRSRSGGIFHVILPARYSTCARWNPSEKRDTKRPRSYAGHADERADAFETRRIIALRAELNQAHIRREENIVSEEHV